MASPRPLFRFCSTKDIDSLYRLIEFFIKEGEETFASAFVNRRCNVDKDFKNKQWEEKDLKAAYSIWATGDLKDCYSKHPLYGSAVASTTSPEESGRVATSPVVPVTDNSREEISRLQSQISDFETQVKDLQTQISSAEETKQKIEAELACCQSERQKLLDEINRLTAQLADENNQIQTVQAQAAEIDDLRQLLNEKFAEIDTLRQQLESVRKIDQSVSNDDKDAELANLRQQLAEKTVEFSVLEQRLDDKDNEISALNKDIDSLNRLVDEKKEMISALEQLVADKDNEIGNLKQKINESEQTVSSLNRLVDEKKETISALEQLVVDKDNEIGNLKQKINEFEQTVSSLNRLVDEKKETISALEQLVAGKDNEIGNLRNNIADLETAKKQLEEELVMYKAILPAEIFSLVGICFENHADASLKTLLFSFLLVTSHSPIEDESFVMRFNTFDKELFRLFKNDPEKLTSLRTHIQEFLNARLENHKINWDLIGNVYDEELHRTDDSIGQTVLAVEAALITGKTCQRAKVRTSNE